MPDARMHHARLRRATIAIAWIVVACRPDADPVPPTALPPGASRDAEPAAGEGTATPAPASVRHPPDPAAPEPAAPEPTRDRETTTTRPPAPVPDAPLPAYARGAWQHWIDADGDCQDTRTEVLIAESRTPVTFADDRHCQVTRGQWVCPYTGKRVTDPALLDIDHLVPLKRAHEAGGGRWDSAMRAAYANDLDDPMALIAVDRSANRSRGARGVDEWLPPEPSHRCAFLEAYAGVVRRWNLELGPEEDAALFQFLETCDAGNVPDLPQLALPRDDVRALTDPEPAGPTGRCCKHCKSGKPCGDTCIPKNRTCHAGKGCAC